MTPYERSHLERKDINNLMQKKADIDVEADFFCEMCEETKKCATGETGDILDKFYRGTLDSVDRGNILAIDRRIFNRIPFTEPITGMPTHL